MKRFLSELFGRKSRSARNHSSRQARLAVEGLEDRRLMNAGWLDNTFGAYGLGKTVVGFDINGGRTDVARAIAVQADGKIVVAGSAAYGTNDDVDFAVTRLNPDGSRDTSFGSNGRTTIAFDLGGYLADHATAVAIDAAGNIVVSGSVDRGNSNQDIGTARLTPNGWLDYSFGVYGKSVAAFDIGGDRIDTAADMTIDAQGRIVIVGTAQYSYNDYDFAVVRLQSNGSFDRTFYGSGKRTVAFDLGPSLADYASAVALDASGRIVVAGTAGSDFAVTRLLENGSYDTSFGSYGKLNLSFDLFFPGHSSGDFASDLAIDASGRIVVAGGTNAEGYNNAAFAVARLNASGSFDSSFGYGGLQIVQFDRIANGYDAATAVAIDAAGGVVLAGWAATAGTSYDSTLTRLDANGWFDPSFGQGGRQWFDLSGEGYDDQVFDMVLDGNGQIVLAGYTDARTQRLDPINADFLIARVNGVQVSTHIDARNLLGDYLWVDYVSYETASPFPVTLTPGQHAFWAYGGSTQYFDVAADGTVNYDPALDGILSGRGTRTLVITGRPVQVDATGLLNPYLWVDYTAFDSATAQTVSLLPGQHAFWNYGGATQYFNVAADGTVDYDPALDGILSGRGTPTLVITGRPVQINATDLHNPYLWVDYTAFDSTTAQTVSLLPGQHAFWNYGGSTQYFDVAADGTVSYDASLEGVVSGQGTTALAIHGRQVTIDATALSNPYLWVDYTHFESFGSRKINLLPGQHSFWNYGGDSLNFEVALDGTVSYEAELEGIISGQGTTSLTIHGVEITIDFVATSSPYWWVDYAGYDAATLTSLRVLPGLHAFWTTTSPSYYFTVARDGAIDFDAALDAVFSGRGTSGLEFLQ